MGVLILDDLVALQVKGYEKIRVSLVCLKQRITSKDKRQDYSCIAHIAPIDGRSNLSVVYLAVEVSKF